MEDQGRKSFDLSATLHLSPSPTSVAGRGYEDVLPDNPFAVTAEDYLPEPTVKPPPTAGAAVVHRTPKGALARTQHSAW